MAKKDPNQERFSEHPHVTPEEAGAVRDKEGNKLLAGDEGFMEAMADDYGFEFIDETKG